VAKRQINRLTDREVRTAKKDRCDGLGLWLQYSPTYDARSWIFRYRFDGIDRQMGLGSALTVSLATARELAQDARNLLIKKIDPRDERDRLRREREVERAKALTFRQRADAVIERDKGSWKNKKHAAQWRATVEKTTAPINAMPVKDIEKADVLRVVKPLWTATPETARRVRARIEAILDYAIASELRPPNSNCATMEVLEALLPKRQKTAKQHFAALPYKDVPEFMTTLRRKQGVSARCLEFLILTAARASEATGARWCEIDLGARTWTVPAERMKASAEHVVPLCDRAMAILTEMPRDGDLVFPGQRGELSAQALRDMAAGIRADCTVHGFRSSFRDWAGDQTNFPREIAEAALAHKIGNAVEQSYRRGAALEKRRKLMGGWSGYCEQPPVASRDNVVAIGAAR
jgi:integrase